MKTNYHQASDEVRPKRGDILQSNVGTKKERTFLVLSAHVLPTRWCAEMGISAMRTKVWAERWWEIEPEMRMALYRSAQRNGGQQFFTFKRFPAKKKKNFEQYMGGE